MNFTINRTELNSALSIVGKGIKDCTFPILECVHFELKPNELKLTGGNGESFISNSININYGGVGIEFCMPYTRIANLVKDLPEQGLLIDIEGARVIITSQSGRYIIPFEPGSDYPKMNIESAVSLTVDAEDLLNNIDKSVFACLQDQLRPELTGVYTEIEDGILSMTATNVIILSNIKTPLEAETKARVIIPQKTLLALLSLTPTDKVEIQLTSNNISFVLNGNITIKSVLLEGKYPDYRAISPKNNQFKCVIDRNFILGAVKRVSQFAMDDKSTIKLSFTKDNCALNTSNPREETADEELKCEYTGDDLVIGVNSDKFIDCLEKTTGQNATMLLNDHRTAIVLTGDNEDNMMLIMPFSV